MFALPGRSIDWVTVGDPGNGSDTATGFGGVASSFQIARHETSYGEYADFLNAVARDDPNGLYDDGMAGPLGGLLRSGTLGQYSYSAIPGREDHPVGFVSFYDAIRYANWLHHGRPIGAQGPTTTEDGAYTITPTGIAGNAVTRNPSALFFLPSEDEWYKAAYFGSSSSTGYYTYPTRSDAELVCSPPSADPERANCGGAASVPPDTTPVGSYPGSTGPYGTLDQAGNVSEWTEGVVALQRVRRGGGFGSPPSATAAASRSASDPSSANSSTGFRVARPLSAVPTLGVVAMSLLAAASVFVGIRRLEVTR
jgi:formylglycine-generating enzyme required for sulfatase activity